MYIANRWLNFGNRVGDAATEARKVPILGEVRRQPPRLVPGEQLGRLAPTRLVLEVETPKRLPVRVADDEAGVVRLMERPGRRKAAGGGHGTLLARPMVRSPAERTSGHG